MHDSLVRQNETPRQQGVAGVRTDQMLAEPFGCGGFCRWKLVAIGVEVSAAHTRCRRISASAPCSFSLYLDRCCDGGAWCHER
jgi:hypothetical protein